MWKRSSVKKISESGKQLKLFTSHYDARNKISSKRELALKQKKTQGGPKNIAKKALKDVRSSKRQKDVNQRRNPHPPKPIKEKQPKNNDRESKFTGKSIQIKTRNSSLKEKETQVQYNSLSILAKKTSRASPPFQRKATAIPQQMTYQPSLDYPVSPPKKTIPAKMVISNLHPNVTQDDIKELFGAVGKLKDFRLKNIGTAEVIYINSEDAFQAYNKYNTRNLDGQPMILKITTVDEPASSFMDDSERFGKPQQQRSGRNQTTSATTGKPVVFTVRL